MQRYLDESPKEGNWNAVARLGGSSGTAAGSKRAE